MTGRCSHRSRAVSVAFSPLPKRRKFRGRIDAKVAPQYGYDWPFEDTVSPTYGAAHVPGKAAHNFHFTTHLTSWFKYDDVSPARLDFAGDDDLWVFVNGKLAVDLGGVHHAGETSLTLDASAATNLGLQAGGVYRIDIFHAERKKESSSLRVTLPGFDLSRSECRRL